MGARAERHSAIVTLPSSSAVSVVVSQPKWNITETRGQTPVDRLGRSRSYPVPTPEYRDLWLERPTLTPSIVDKVLPTRIPQVPTIDTTQLQARGTFLIHSAQLI
jgi:hypothetical protein